MPQKPLRIIGYTVVLIAVLNFLAFMIVDFCIGGDAFNGKIEGGRYFVADHGRFTEVSPRIWYYSRSHAISIFITHPLGILLGGGLIAYSDRKKQADARKLNERFTLHVTDLLKRAVRDLHRVDYTPASFMRSARSTLPLLHVSFIVGPGTDVEVRTVAHRHFEQLLAILAPLPQTQQAILRLHALRHIPPQSDPDHPPLYIECLWKGTELARMLHDADYSSWHTACDMYVNRLDERDPLNKYPRKK